MNSDSIAKNTKYAATIKIAHVALNQKWIWALA